VGQLAVPLAGGPPGGDAFNCWENVRRSAPAAHAARGRALAPGNLDARRWPFGAGPPVCVQGGVCSGVEVWVVVVRGKGQGKLVWRGPRVAGPAFRAGLLLPWFSPRFVPSSFFQPRSGYMRCRLRDQVSVSRVGVTPTSTRVTPPTTKGVSTLLREGDLA
jgi:hypothetical protein